MDWVYEGENVSPYNLTQQDLTDIDNIIKESVNSYNSTIKGELRKFLVVDLKKNKYNRQYVSVTNAKGEKLVYVNCICDFYCNNDWKRYLHHINDGGACEFQLILNLNTKKYFSFRINGFA